MPPADPAATLPAASPLGIGARLDRLRWSRAHTGLLIAIGAGWLFDSLEINLVGNVISPLSKHFHASTDQSSRIYWVWLIAIMFGALVGGRLADAFGRRRLFVFTLLWYSAFTMLTALSPTLNILYGLRFLTGLGVGAEYGIITAAITEFMPSRVRGRASAAVMNFWPIGAIASGLIAYILLNTFSLPDTVSWRYGFALGGIVALIVLFFRRRLPESPRWLASQGRLAEADAIVRTLEQAAGIDPRAHAATAAAEPPAVNARQALQELVRRYPGRLALGCALDLSEAFGFYGLFAVLSIVVLEKVHYTDGQIPFVFILGNVGALIGGIAMTAGFDRLGRRLTIGTYYTLAGASVGLLALATDTGNKTWVLLAFMVANAFATGAWTAAYPTFTELFPTHLRAVGVGTSVAVGRIGAAYGTLYLPSLAERIGPTASYLLIIAFWAVGVIAIAIWSATGGIEAAGKPLDLVSTVAHPTG
ncbi:Sugar phosphate permease [Streptomyces sp. DvalAA-14]|uniref:MFS transporter n=1 Tax=unclassified Streptomyces TaxID=2593676 RepID=UPI00081BB4AE|nr:MULTISPECIES: MFS transporter [unclassified Streptomyces]MYS23795.1 MFS transporter [Streptomyces sp. SID4948]SCE38758.1 Sugar phosphate permease [Streptomyces sp. DvalAA-14]